MDSNDNNKFLWNQFIKLGDMIDDELHQLRNAIDNQLKINAIKKETFKLNKNTILSLEQGDKIFGIRLSYGAHKLEETGDFSNGIVDVVDYCNITGINIKDNNKTCRISISHPSVPFGISTSLDIEEYKNEHCLMFMDKFSSGYSGFFTLKPHAWKEDLKRMLDIQIEHEKNAYIRDTNILKNKIDCFNKFEDYINQHIKSNLH